MSRLLSNIKQKPNQKKLSLTCSHSPSPLKTSSLICTSKKIQKWKSKPLPDYTKKKYNTFTEEEKISIVSKIKQRLDEENRTSLPLNLTKEDEKNHYLSLITKFKSTLLVKLLKQLIP